MNHYYYVIAHDNDSQYEFYVFVDDKKDITDAILSEEFNVIVDKIYGPHKVTPRMVLSAKEPK